MKRIDRNRITLLALLLALSSPHVTAGTRFAVPPELWEQPRTGAIVRGQATLRQGVEAWLAQPERVLVIHHGNREEPALRAEELRAWLIALAVPASHIQLAGDLNGDELYLELSSSKGKK